MSGPPTRRLTTTTAGDRLRIRRRRKSPTASPAGSDPQAENPKKRAKRKRAKYTSPSSTSSEDGTTASSGTVSDSDNGAAGRSVGAGNRAELDAKWELLKDVWPINARPKKLRQRQHVDGLSWETLTALQTRYEKEAERKGVGAAIYGRDRKLKKAVFKKQSDNGFSKLHPAR